MQFENNVCSKLISMLRLYYRDFAQTVKQYNTDFQVMFFGKLNHIFCATALSVPKSSKCICILCHLFVSNIAGLMIRVLAENNRPDSIRRAGEGIKYIFFCRITSGVVLLFSPSFFSRIFRNNPMLSHRPFFVAQIYHIVSKQKGPAYKTQGPVS